MASENSMLVRFWLNSDIISAICDSLDDDDEAFCSLRLTSRNLAAIVAPHLFKNLRLTFKVDSFSRPGRLDAYSRIGHHVKVFSFEIQYNEAAVLPLDELDASAAVLLWSPATTIPEILDRQLRPPNNVERAMAQWPQIFHAASNAWLFIRFFGFMPNLRQVTIRTLDVPEPQIHQGSALDFAVASISIALEKNKLNDLYRLLLDVHPSIINTLLARSSTPSTRPAQLFRKIRTLKITLKSWDFVHRRDQLIALDGCIRSFSDSLKTFIFRWDGGYGPCPLTLQADPLINPNWERSGSHLLFGEVTSPTSPLPATPNLPEIFCPVLTHIVLENVALTSQQLHDFFAAHVKTLRSYKLETVELTDRGDFQYAVAPLILMDQTSSKWPSTVDVCRRSLNDSGYESYEYGGESVQAVRLAPTHAWGEIYEDAPDCGIPRNQAGSKDCLHHRMIINASSKKRRIKHGRHINSREVAAVLARQKREATQATEAVQENGPSDIVFGASVLSLSPLAMKSTCSVERSNGSLHRRRAKHSQEGIAYEGISPVCTFKDQLPLTPHPAYYHHMLDDVEEELLTPRALPNMRSEPILNGTTYSPMGSITQNYNKDTSGVSTPKLSSGPSIMFLRPAIYDAGIKTTCSVINTTFNTPATPSLDRLASPTSIYSPLFPDQQLGDRVPDTPTPPPLVVRRPVVPRKPISTRFPRQSSSNEYDPFNPDVYVPSVESYRTPTVSTMLGKMIILDPSSNRAPNQQLPTHQSAVAAYKNPRNPLTAAQHLSLVVDPDLCDVKIRNAKENVISNFATKYSLLNTTPSKSTLKQSSTSASTTSSSPAAHPQSPYPILTPTNANYSTHTSSPTALTPGLNIASKMGKSIKASFKSFRTAVEVLDERIERSNHARADARALDGKSLFHSSPSSRSAVKVHVRAASDPQPSSLYSLPQHTPHAPHTHRPHGASPPHSAGPSAGQNHFARDYKAQTHQNTEHSPSTSASSGRRIRNRERAEGHFTEAARGAAGSPREYDPVIVRPGHGIQEAWELLLLKERRERERCGEGDADDEELIDFREYWGAGAGGVGRT